MKPLTIKIPKKLPTAISHSRSSRKVLESWLILKAIYNHGYFNMSNSSLKSLEKDLCVSYKTIARRLNQAEAMGLVSIGGFDNSIVTLKSYDVLLHKYGCSASSFYRVKHELHKKIKIENWLEAKAIEEKHEQCKQAFYAKVQKNRMKEILQQRAKDPKVENASFTKQVFEANVLDYLQGGKTETSYIFNSVRADFNVGYRRLSQMFDYKSKGGMAYKKRKLVLLGLIDIQKRSIEHDYSKTHSTKESRTTDLGTVKYQPIQKNLRLTLPDEITFNSQTKIIAKYEDAAA